MNSKAEMFNRKASDPKNKPDKIIDALSIKPGNQVVDIGSGGGYFCLRFAEIVGKQGKVYALDTDPELLNFVKDNGVRKGFKNIVALLIDSEELGLPAGAIDCIFMRNVAHHLKNRTGYFKNLKKYLKQEGRVAIIDYGKQKPFSFRRAFGHSLPKEAVIGEMQSAGYRLIGDHRFLPQQHFTVYQKG